MPGEHGARAQLATRGRLARALRGAVAGGALFYLALYVFVALSRITHPFELEWMEGGMLEHVRRVLAGQPLYAPPTLEFVSFFYPPLYYWVSAVSAALTGLDFSALRLVSFLSSLGCLILIFAIVRRETGAALPGIAAAGLFVAAFERTGAWLDVGRGDSLFLLLALAAIFRLRAAQTPAGHALAGLLAAAAFLTKQSAVVIFLPLALHAAACRGRGGRVFAVGAFGAMGVAALVLDASSDGWFGYYCFAVPARHPRIPAQIIGFFTRDLLGAMPVACGLALFQLVASLRGPARERWFLPALAAGMLGSSWSVRLLVGAWLNNLLPAAAFLAIASGLSLHTLEQASRRGRRRAWLAAAAPLLLLLQLAGLAYDPRGQIPTPADRAAGRALVARIRGIDGEVFIPHHGYLARMAGKGGQAHALAMDNLFLDDHGPAARPLREAFRRSLEQARYAAVFVESDRRYLRRIRRAYRPSGPLFDDDEVFFPVTGGHLRPEVLYLPRAPAR